jgi:ABC-2 type transport system ATP-binding protein
MDAILEARDLVKSYGRLRAVDGVSLDVRPKEIYGLVGPNGSGKSTVLSMLSGVLRPDAGTVRLDGVPVAYSAARLRLGFVPQEIALYPQMTATENLSFFGRMQGLRGPALRGQVREALDVVDLAAQAGRRVESFSSGMKRRANIAVALVHRPDIIIMDEPTVGVDPQSRNAILDQVAALAGAGTAVVFASHQMEEVQRLCGRIGIIDAGKIVATGTVQDLLARSGAGCRIVVTVAAEAEDKLRSLLLQLPGEAAFRQAGREFQLSSGQPMDTLTQLLRLAEAAGIFLQHAQLIQPTLEDVLLELTGKAPRE